MVKEPQQGTPATELVTVHKDVEAAQEVTECCGYQLVAEPGCCGSTRYAYTTCGMTRYCWQWNSKYCVGLAYRSVLAINAMWALLGINVILSVLSVNSFLSIGCLNSAASIGSINSILSIGCVHGFMQVCL